MTTASAVTKPAQIRITKRSPAYWRVTIDNPPINVMGPEMVIILPDQEIRNFARIVEISAHNPCGYDGHLFAVQPRPEAEGQAPAATERAEAVPSASLRCAITSPMAVRVAGVPAIGFSIAKS
jgi:hypothetical protein